MAVNMEVMLFDAQVYKNTVAPAWRSAVQKHDLKPLVELLRRSETRAQEESRMVSLVRAGTVQRMQIELEEAEKRGDPERTRRARWELYEIVNDKGPDGITRSQIRSALTELLSRRPSGEELSELVDIGGLIELLCVPWSSGVKARLNVSALGVQHYLSMRSELFYDAFSERLPHSALVSSKWEMAFWVEHNEVRKLLGELKRIPAPSDPMPARVFEQFRTLLDAVLADDRLGLLFAQSM